MIVIEGCDGSGKTTLANKLSEDLCLNIGVRGTKNRAELYKVTKPDAYRALERAVAGDEPPLIWDRLGPISDPIYSRVQGRTDAFSPAEKKHFFAVVRALGIPVIVCDVPLYLAQENAKKADQMDGVRQHLPFIHGLYRDFINLSQSWTLRYDYGEDRYSDLLSVLEMYTRKRKDREWH